MSLPHDHLTPQDASVSTAATYDRIATTYLEKWRDRSAVRQHLARFADMLRVYGLADRLVVDVGCGPGFDAAFLRQSGLRAIGVDLSRAMMKAGRPEFGGDYLQADMRQLPLAPDLGGLWVSASLLHLPRQETPGVLAEFARVLAPGGLLYLSLKAGHGDEWTTESHGQPLPRYFVYWQPEILDRLLRGAGFRVIDGWISPAIEGTRWLIRFARTDPSVTLLSLVHG